MVKPRVYFAGKIEKNNRKSPHQISIGDFNFPQGDEYIEEEHPTYITTGPLTIADDHGCCHGDNTHGCGEDCCQNINITRQTVLGRCMKQIDRSDLIIVKYDSIISCYGTIAELGYAYAQGKIIFMDLSQIKTDKQKKDLWFGIFMSINSIQRTQKKATELMKLFPEIDFSYIKTFLNDNKMENPRWVGYESSGYHIG